MLHEWYISGLSALQLENISINETSVRDIESIIRPIMAIQGRPNYYFDLERKEPKEYTPKENLTAFSRTFFAQQSPHAKSTKGRVNDFSSLDRESQEKINRLPENIKRRVKRTRKDKIIIVTSAEKEFSDYFFDLLNKWKSDKKKRCSFCEIAGADTLEGWIFPFIIAKQNFPNLYSEGKIESINVCKKCAFILFAAYHNTFFNLQQDLNFLFFFHTDHVQLTNVLREVFAEVQESITPNYAYNFRVEDICYYPYEFLILAINRISKRFYGEVEMKSGALDPSQANLGAYIFNTNIVTPAARKKLFKFGERVDNLNLAFRLLKILKEEAPSDKMGRTIPTFEIFFKNLKSDNTEDRQYFIRRNLLVKDLLVFKRINWQVIEEALFYNIREKAQSLPFSNIILPKIMEVYNMPDRETYERVGREGWKLATKLLQVEGYDPNDRQTLERARDKVKTYLYELRRARKIGEFLDKLNGLQLRAETQIDVRPFIESEREFYNLKVYCLVEMANTIFRA